MENIGYHERPASIVAPPNSREPFIVHGEQVYFLTLEDSRYTLYKASPFEAPSYVESTSGVVQLVSNGSHLYYLTFRSELDFDDSIPVRRWVAKVWISDGSRRGAELLHENRDVRRRPTDASSIGVLAVLGERVFYSVGGQLWMRTDRQTRLVADAMHSIDALTVVGGKLYFRKADEAANPVDADLWVTDGSPEGTHQLTEIPPGARPVNLTEINGELFFQLKDEAGEFWTSDGTPSGTVPVQSPPAALRSEEPPLAFPVQMNGVEIFAADDDRNGNELWTRDPVTSETSILFDLRTPLEDFMHPTAVGSQLFFGTPGKLWTANATGVTLVRDLPAHIGWPEIDDIWLGSLGDLLRFTQVGERTYFHRENVLHDEQ